MRGRREWRARTGAPAALGVAALVIAVLAAACDDADLVDPAGGVPSDSALQAAGNVQTALTFALPPGNLTITPAGRRIMSLHQYYAGVRVLGEARDDGSVVNYPESGEGVMPSMAAVLGIRSDTAGVLYILDNGNSGKAPPKVVVWDSRTNRLVRTIPLRQVTDTNSFVNDLAFDYRRNHIYLTDPAGGPNAAFIVIDLGSGQARRVLQGHASVVPEQFEFSTEGITPTRRRRDGSLERPRIGVDGIVIDYQREWVYYGPLHGRSMYRVRAADLANAGLSAADLGGRVERYSSKPPSDGMAIDQAGNIYLGDLPNNAIGVVTTDRQYRELVRRDDLSWVDDFEFGPDGALYVVTTQLHRSPELNAAVRAERLPWRVFRMRPLAPGRQGY